MAADIVGLEAAEQWLDDLVTSLEPAQRRAMLRTIGNAVRKDNIERIRSQKNPDGSAYEPRKSRGKKGAIRRKMFARLSTISKLKVTIGSDDVRIGYRSANAKIASIHQYGHRIRHRGASRAVQYPMRELLGFSKDTHKLIEQAVLDKLVK